LANQKLRPTKVQVYKRSDTIFAQATHFN